MVTWPGGRWKSQAEEPGRQTRPKAEATPLQGLRLPEGNRSQRAIDRPVRSQLALVQGHLVDCALAKAYVLVLLDRSQHPLPPAERTHPSQGQVRGELPFFRWEVERHQRGLDRFAQLFEPLSAEPDP